MGKKGEEEGVKNGVRKDLYPGRIGLAPSSRRSWRRKLDRNPCEAVGEDSDVWDPPDSVTVVSPGVRGVIAGWVADARVERGKRAAQQT